MFGIGNKFGGNRRSATMIEKRQAESTVPLTDARLTLERAGKALEAKSDELTAARSRVVELDRLIGEKLSDDENADSDTAHRQSMLAHIQQLESVVAVLLQRKNEAEASLQRAKQATQNDKVDAAKARLNALGPRADEVFAAVKQLATDLAFAAEELRVAGGNEKHSYGATEIRGQFDLFFGLAKHPLTNNGHVPTAFMKYKNFSDCLTAVCAMRVKP